MERKVMKRKALWHSRNDVLLWSNFKRKRTIPWNLRGVRRPIERKTLFFSVYQNQTLYNICERSKQDYARKFTPTTRLPDGKYGEQKRTDFRFKFLTLNSSSSFYFILTSSSALSPLSPV